ncbi:MAG: nucleotidyltransferase family protein [Betaproteobacteria bacterium]|nr:nucleotidyltransferase family protein [Betaproteobacteria bacterium]MBP6647230.1 nucleotidyltransferase family protein [Burkholderiaceae bacterium]
MDADPNQLPTVLVLASGKGARFLASGGQGHKLHALLNGKSVLERTLDAVRASGLPWHLEDAGHPGMGDSIAAAVRATSGANGWLILPGDLPLVQPETLFAVATALKAGGIVVPVHACATKPERGHPVGFPVQYREALLALSGDKGAVGILRQADCKELPVNDPGVVADVDTVEALEQLSERLRSGGLLVRDGQ